jgi:Leucine-rich repeat (LRR) protein
MTEITNITDLYLCNKELTTELIIIDVKITRDDLLFIFTFKNLDRIELIRNDIDEIPEEISNLKKLKILSISLNNITKLPKSIKELKLTHLFLNKNNILCLQDEIFELYDLECLEIKNNKISVIPEKIYNLENLRILGIDNIDCSYNNVFYMLNDRLYKVSVCDFNFKYNKNNIVKLPNEIANLQYLVNFNTKNIKDEYKIFGEDMIIFDKGEIKDIVVPDNIKYLSIIFEGLPNKYIIKLLDNLPFDLVRLSLSNVNIDNGLENLPTNLKELCLYTAPYCNLIGLPKSFVVENIKKYKIPFGCKIFCNDKEIIL